MSIQINGNTDTISANDNTMSIVDKDGSTGTAGQVLTSTGPHLDWRNINDLVTVTGRLFGFSTGTTSLSYTPQSSNSTLIIVAQVTTYVNEQISTLNLRFNGTIVKQVTVSAGGDQTNWNNIPVTFVHVHKPGSGTYTYDFSQSGPAITLTNQSIIILEYT